MADEAETDDRTEPPFRGAERETLVGFLRWQRETLERKCGGLDPDELARRSVEPSGMSLLGLIRHMAEVERFWFRRVMTGEDAPPHYTTELEPDLDFEFDQAAVDDELVADALATWRSEVAYADAFVAGAADLDVTGKESHRGAMALRWILVHMIEEYARHNGHADLLRERIDGATGQ